MLPAERSVIRGTDAENSLSTLEVLTDRHRPRLIKRALLFRW